MKAMFICALFFLLNVAFAQTPPANTDVGAADSSNESWLGCVTAGGTQHLVALARTPYPKVGHRISTDGGSTWSGSDTSPGNGTNGNDPWGAVDVQNGYVYASYEFVKVARSTDWGATWGEVSVAGVGDAPTIAVDNSSLHPGRHTVPFGARSRRVYIAMQ